MTARARPMIGRIDHVLLLVNDLSKAIGFYEDVLGCEVESRLPKYAMAELRAGVCHLDLVDISSEEGSWARPTPQGGRNVDHVALAVESPNAAALREYLHERNVPIVEERIENGLLSLYVRDPSGNTIELQAQNPH